MAGKKKQVGKTSNVVAFYLRVSTKRQDTKEGSLPTQQQRLEE